MPRKCCVPGCRSNYGNEAVSVFYWPKSKEQSAVWLQKINRQGFTPSRTTVVCIKHFPSNKVLTVDKVKKCDGTVLQVPRDRPRLTAHAIPSIFPGRPSCLTSPPAPQKENVSSQLPSHSPSTAKMPSINCKSIDGGGYIFVSSDESHPNDTELSNGGLDGGEFNYSGLQNTMTWSSASTLALINCIQKYVQLLVNPNVKKRHVWKTVSEEMKLLDFEVSCMQVENKWKNMLLACRKYERLSQSPCQRPGKQPEFLKELKTMVGGDFFTKTSVQSVAEKGMDLPASPLAPSEPSADVANESSPSTGLLEGSVAQAEVVFKSSSVLEPRKKVIVVYPRSSTKRGVRGEGGSVANKSVFSNIGVGNSVAKTSVIPFDGKGSSVVLSSVPFSSVANVSGSPSVSEGSSVATISQADSSSKGQSPHSRVPEENAEASTDSDSTLSNVENPEQSSLSPLLRPSRPTPERPRNKLSKKFCRKVSLSDSSLQGNSAKKLRLDDVERDDDSQHVLEDNDEEEDYFLADVLCDSSDEDVKDCDHTYSFPPGLGEKKLFKAPKKSLSDEKLDKVLCCVTSINTTLSKMYGVERRKLQLLNARNKIMKEKNDLFREMLQLKKRQLRNGTS